jgi:hypothetical protein
MAALTSEDCGLVKVLHRKGTSNLYALQRAERRKKGTGGQGNLLPTATGGCSPQQQGVLPTATTLLPTATTPVAYSNTNKKKEQDTLTRTNNKKKEAAAAEGATGPTYCRLQAEYLKAFGLKRFATAAMAQGLEEIQAKYGEAPSLAALKWAAENNIRTIASIRTCAARIYKETGNGATKQGPAGAAVAAGAERPRNIRDFLA